MLITGTLYIALGIVWILVSWAKIAMRDKVLTVRQIADEPSFVGLAILAVGLVLLLFAFLRA